MLVLIAAVCGFAAGSDWHWVAPPADANAAAKFAGAPLRALTLEETPPANVVVKVAPRGKARYAQLRFGTPDSRRVALLLDCAADGTRDLYADTNRDRLIETSELARRDSDGWIVPLTVALAAGDDSDENSGDGAGAQPSRDLFFRVGKSGAVLACAVRGWLEGTAKVAGREITVRRVDGDANGLLGDLQDALWLDLDGSGEWDPLEERFACVPLIQLWGQRFAVHADEFGRALSLEEVQGVGKVKLVVAAPLPGTRVASLQVTLGARDGSAFRAKGEQPTLELPPGDYRVVALTVDVASDAHSGSTTYVFTRARDGRDSDWHTLTREGELTFDPLGTLNFGAEVTPIGSSGNAYSVQPQLSSSEGLRIVSATTSDARIELRGARGDLLGSARSGFM